MVIKRGQIWLINFNPGFGTELHKNRPAIVISSKEVNKYHPRVIVIPISTKDYSGYSVVKLGLKTSGLGKESYALPVEIRAIDKARLIKRLGKISKPQLEQIEEALKLVLGMIELD